MLTLPPERVEAERTEEVYEVGREAHSAQHIDDLTGRQLVRGTIPASVPPSRPQTTAQRAAGHAATTGDPTNRRTLVRIPAADGNPDGMTVDAAGNLWVAFWGGRAARCFSPDGKLLAELPLPAANVTSCAFGAPDLADLYVTTASLWLTGEEREAQPHAVGGYSESPRRQAGCRQMLSQADQGARCSAVC